MITSPAILAAAQPKPGPDLSREALLTRLHFPAPRTEGLENMLELPPRPAHRKGGPRLQNPGGGAARRRISLPPLLFAALIGPDSPSQSLVATAFDLTALQQQAAAEFQSHTEPGLAAACPPSNERLLPLAGYQELRGLLAPLLDSHALLRERWLELLLPRLCRRAATADALPPDEEALRCQWQARLELKPAPTLPEFLVPGKDPKLAR